MSVVDFSKLYPDNRQEGETVLRQAQLVMLRMLKIIDYICRKHDISYWMCSGTLLGAVRHKGFIPWDDDLDICMIREDYERFVEIAVNEFPEDMMLQTERLILITIICLYLVRLETRKALYYLRDMRMKSARRGCL